ncbi:MAG: radical SAM protein [Faecousia sp.]
MSFIDALLYKAAQERSPIAGTFELTARCSLSCKMCYIHDAACEKAMEAQELSTQEWIDIADQAMAAGTLVLLLTGGEPMLRRDFPEIYRACAERGFLLTVNTNGTLFTPEIFDLFCEHPPLRVNVSLYAMRAEIYESLCGSGAAFARVLRHLRTLSRRGISIQINFTATPYNQQELAAVHAFAEEIGAAVHYTAYTFPPTRTLQTCSEPFRRFTPEQAAEATVEYLRITHSPEDFAAYCRKNLIQPPPRSDDCGEFSDGARCRAGRGSYWITYDGKMLPCGMLPGIAFSVPALGLLPAWKKTVEAFAAVKMPAGCVSCPDYARCEVCPAICFAENGGFSAVPEYICCKNRHYFEELRNISTGSEGSA